MQSTVVTRVRALDFDQLVYMAQFALRKVGNTQHRCALSEPAREAERI